MTDEEKLKAGWIASCVTGEFIDPNTMPIITQLMKKIGDHSIVGGYYTSVDICGNPNNIDIRAEAERGNVELLRKRRNQKEDDEKIAKGWMYSCVTGQLTAPNQMTAPDPTELSCIPVSMTEQLMIDGWEIITNTDPAPENFHDEVTKAYSIGYPALSHRNKTGECGVALGYEALNYNPYLDTTDEDATGNQDSL